MTKYRYKRTDLLDKYVLLEALAAAKDGVFLADKREMRDTVGMMFSVYRCSTERTARANWKNLHAAFQKTFFHA